MDQPVTTPTQRWQRRLYIAGPLAAAAVVVLAFIGVFDPPEGKVLSGGKQLGPAGRTRQVETVPTKPEIIQEDDEPASKDQDERALEAWLEQTKENVDAKRQSGESLQRVLGLTVRQVLDIVKQAEESAKDKDKNSSTADKPEPAAPKTPATEGGAEIEDL